MRLTLRTLMAYLDGALTPQDSESIDDKLSQSEFAKSLVSRIISVTKSSQLGVYDVRGGELDTREVAAYLDNNLATERVISLEKTMIESDLALAEVSSCHKILCRVMNDSVAVDKEILQRVYSLDSRLGKASTLGVSKSRIVKSQILNAARTLENIPLSSVPLQIKVFISHSTKDRDFVEQELLQVLQTAGVETWYSGDDIHTGAHWEREINAALKACDSFLLIMSKNSAQSEWVRDELHWAIKNRRGAIIPFIIDACDPYDFHIRLDRIQAVDIRNGRQEAIRRVLALLAERHGKQTQN